MSDTCAFILHAYTRSEKADEFEALFRSYVAASRAEDGCIEYHMLRDGEDPTLFIFYEVWQSSEHLQAHSALPHMRRFDEQRMDFLTREFEIRPIEMISQSSSTG